MHSSLLYIFFLLIKYILLKLGRIPLWFAASLAKRQSGFLIYRLYALNRKRSIGRPKKFRLSRNYKIILSALIFFIFITIYSFSLLTAAYQLPTPTRLAIQKEPLTSEFYDRNGTILYRHYEGNNRTLINLADIPKELIDATIATEDKNFYKHIGIDPLAIMRAFYRNITVNSEEGASTITQQLIKNSLLTTEKSFTRKVREAILAIWAESIYSKDEILRMYFNETPYGGSLIGVAAASETYFHKSPSQLNLAESAYLAGLPASPTKFSPYGPTPGLSKIRQQEVLTRMVKMGYIKKDEAEKAFNEKLNIKPLVNNISAPHFVFYIRDLLTEKYGSKIVSQGGLKIYTSLDLKLQEEAEKIMRSEIDKLGPLNVKNGAAMIMDAQSGQILAMVGSRDYHYPDFGNYNVATALRQPGSAIKPVTYAAALEKGFNPNSIILDTPVTFRDEWGNAYSPVNYDGTYRGPVTLRQALASSLNIPAVRVLATIGIESFAKTAGDLGITTFENPDRFGLSLTLGGGEVRMLELMGVYGAFAQGGKFTKPTGILKITDSQGNILEEYRTVRNQAVSPQIAYLITNILSDDNARRMAFGINSLLKIQGFEVAVKTGTSDNKRDNWTFGYTPKYVVGVWVGNPDNSPMNQRLASGITGAAPIWNKIMHFLLDGTKPLAFEKPPGLTEDTISGVIPKAMVRIQKKEDKIVFSDAFSSYATTSAQANPAQPNL